MDGSVYSVAAEKRCADSQRSIRHKPGDIKRRCKSPEFGSWRSTRATSTLILRAILVLKLKPPADDVDQKYQERCVYPRRRNWSRQTQGKLYLMGRKPKAFFRILELKNLTAQLERMLSRELGTRRRNHGRTVRITAIKSSLLLENPFR